MDIVKQLLKLPSEINFEGICFELQIIKDAPDELRLVYDISYVVQDSPHKARYEETGSWINSFHNDYRLQGFLYLCEGIKSDEMLKTAILYCKDWLKEKGLMK